ncbi:NAD(P)H-dependent flavin oxidoreductase [Bdellovibrio sp. HCB288]|uniref:NAD(P)H-dependent flavin oxidoreductase n=1 Tax=Bdellovibrio sp. HCB288 TaxID=3394355 RepID=UPI0039B392CD
MHKIGNISLKNSLILAPMAGGPSTPRLAAAVSNAGGLGSLGCAYESPDQMQRTIQTTKSLTEKPFAVGLFAPLQDPVLNNDQIEKATAALAIYRKELEINTIPSLASPMSIDFDRQFEIILKEAPAAFSFTFGLVPKECILACRSRKIVTIGTATTLDEAQLLIDLGVDAIVAQGVEAGGHRGIFSLTGEDPQIKMLDLVKTLSQTVKTTIIAAGGMMTGQDIRAALNNGAHFAQLGTAFLLCQEAGTSETYRTALLNFKNSKTDLTRAFSGRIARGIENRFLKEMKNKAGSILPFPAQNNFTRDIRNKATQLGKSEFLSLWAGEGVAKIRSLSAKDLVEILWQETSVV